MIKKINLFILFVFLSNILIQNVNLKNVSAQENVNLEINLVKAITGTAPFNTTGAGAGLHPGDDYSADDNYVRTLDIITYELHYSVNPAGGVANNTIITSTIPLNAEGKTVAVWEDKLTTMYPGLTISDDGRTLTYNIGDVKAGNAYTFSPTAKVLTTAANGETFSVSASISADNANIKTTQPYTATVSAMPKVDLSKQTDGSFDAPGPNGEKGKVYTFAIGLTIGDGKGGEAIPGTITFTDDLSDFGLPNARLYNFDGKPAVGVNGDGRCLVSLPNGGTATTQYDEFSVSGTPTISATQASPGSNVDISISNIDQAGRYFPTKTANGTAIPADKKYIFAGYISLWVDYNDIPVGYTDAINKYTNLSLTGVSGTPNYGGQSEPLDNNVVKFNVYRAPDGTGNFSGNYLMYTISADEYRQLPTQMDILSGDGVVYPGQVFGLTATSGNGGNIPLNNYEMLIKIDPSRLKVTDLQGKPGVAYVLKGTPGLEDILQVQYGTGTYDNFDIQQNDTAEGVTWYNSTTEALDSGTGPINKVRLITKPGKSLPVGADDIMFGVNVTALDNPINTVIPSVMAIRADEVNGGNWQMSNYDPINHNRNMGDRVFITEVLSRIQKDTEPSGIQTAEVNKEVTFKITPTLTTDSRYTNVTTVDNVTVRDTLPKGLTYIQGSGSLEPDSVAKNQDGTTTIQWTLTNVNINAPIEPILYKTIVDFDVKNATVLENKTVISTPLDSSAEAFRTSKYGLNIVNLSAWGIGKSTPKPITELGDDLTYTLKYAVFKEEAFSDFNFIDILPYNGDTRTPVTSFNGSYTIKELSGTNGETFYFTTDPQSSINRDPSLNTNTWTPYTPEAAAGKNITAIKVHANTLTSTDGVKEVTVKLAPANNKGGDIYTNNFSGRVSNVNAIVYSNDVPITVVSSSVGDYVWNDANGNGVKDSGEAGIHNVTVNLLDQQGNKIASTVTNSEGYYSFTELHSGSYQVKVDESTLPNNLIQTYDLDKVLDNSTAIQLDADTKNHDANFGYKEKLGNLVVKYLEQGTNKELAPEVTDIQKVGTDYTIKAEIIYGYSLVSAPSNATGKYIDGTVEVIYYYTKAIPWIPLLPAEKLGNLVVKYLEQGTNKELASEVTGKEKVGTDYTTKAEIIDGYTLVSTPSNATGKYVDGTVEVIYYYTKAIPWTPLEPAEKLGNLVVKYLEQGTNKELASEVTGKEKVGTDYTTTSEAIDGYTLVSTPSNATGKYVDGTVEVIYYYTKTTPWTPLEPAEKLGNLVVKYLEQGTNKELSSQITDKKLVGTEYSTTEKDIDGYELVGVSSNETGKYIDGTVEVIYYYAPKKVIGSQDIVQHMAPKDTEQQDKIQEGALSLPKTGNESYILYYVLGALFLIVGLRLTSRKSKKI